MRRTFGSILGHLLKDHPAPEERGDPKEKRLFPFQFLLSYLVTGVTELGCLAISGGMLLRETQVVALGTGIPDGLISADFPRWQVALHTEASVGHRGAHLVGGIRPGVEPVAGATILGRPVEVNRVLRIHGRPVGKGKVMARGAEFGDVRCERPRTLVALVAGSSIVTGWNRNMIRRERWRPLGNGRHDHRQGEEYR